MLNGKKADVGRILTQLPKLGRYILQVILIQLMVVLPMVLYIFGLIAVAAVLTGLSFTDIEHWGRAFRGTGVAVLALGILAMVPVILYVALPLMFANMELVYGDSGPVESLRRAFVIGRGHRFSVLGFGFIAFVVIFVGLLACCVGILPAMGLAYLVLCGLYLALRNGSGLPPPVDA